MARLDHTRFVMDEEALWFGGVAAQQGPRNTIDGTDGDDVLIGTRGGDDFHLEMGGRDEVSGSSGNDWFYFGDSYNGYDKVFGGAGVDRVIIGNTRERPLVFNGASFQTEMVQLGAYAYNIKLIDNHSDLRVLGQDSKGLFIDGRNAGVNLDLRGGAGSDQLLGGAGDDVIYGGMGQDYINGGGGHNIIVYTSFEDSIHRYTDSVDVVHGDIIRFDIPGIQLSYNPEDGTGGYSLDYHDDHEFTLLSIYGSDREHPLMNIALGGDARGAVVNGNDLVF